MDDPRDGATGWDWVITSFQLARQAFPNAKLLINEYGTENDANARNQYLNIINLLKARGLIDVGATELILGMRAALGTAEAEAVAAEVLAPLRDSIG